MCSLTESELEPALIKKTIDPDQIKTCKKCKENKPSVNLRVNDAYCKTCFLTSVHHKFRATLGKHKAMKPGEKVCVAYSGGTASTSLIHMLKMGIESDHKKLLFVPQVLHVDEGAAFNLNKEQRLANIREKLSYVSSLGFKVYVSLLEQPARIWEWNDGEIEIQEEKAKAFYDSLQNVKESSAKEEFLTNLRRQAILLGTEEMNCSKVFTGETATKVSIDLLTGVSLGKGENLAQETGFRDTRNAAVMILRPLRDISGKEIALYSLYHKLNIFADPTIATGKESLFSLRKLTEDFLIGLQNDFPATLSTVFKTSDKLQVQKNNVDTTTSGECVLCHGSLDTDSEEHNSLQATYWSTIVSSKGKKLDENLLCSDKLAGVDLSTLSLEDTSTCVPDSGECCGQGDGSCQTSASKSVTKSDLMKLVCFSCMKIVLNFRNVQNLPPLLMSDVQKARNRSAMKSEIQEFLL